MGCGSSSSGKAMPALSDDQKQIIKDSWNSFKAKNAGADFNFGVFIFVKMFELSPDVIPLFEFLKGIDTNDVNVLSESGQMQMHIGRVISTIDTAVQNVDNLSPVAPVVVKLGARHQGYGAKAEHCSSVACGVLYALEKALGDEFTTEVNRAWSMYLQNLARFMLSAYK